MGEILKIIAKIITLMKKWRDKMQQVKICGVIHNVEVQYETVKHGTDMIAFREYLPDGTLGKMQHLTPKRNLIEELEKTDG